MPAYGWEVPVAATSSAVTEAIARGARWHRREPAR